MVLLYKSGMKVGEMILLAFYTVIRYAFVLFCGFFDIVGSLWDSSGAVGYTFFAHPGNYALVCDYSSGIGLWAWANPSYMDLSLCV